MPENRHPPPSGPRLHRAVRGIIGEQRAGRGILCGDRRLVALDGRSDLQGVIWGVNSFDQWGVELGKQLALQIAPAIEGDEAAIAAQDASTRALLAYYAAHRTV